MVGIAASPYGQVVGVGTGRQRRVAQDIAVGPVGEYPFTTARRSAPGVRQAPYRTIRKRRARATRVLAPVTFSR